jgi:NAD(P)-dependent dehydrogenase (short-subunit alcohol dehydrogenase family)
MSGMRTPLEKAVGEAVSRFGRLDIVIANAGIVRLSKSQDERQVFRDISNVNLIGVWNTVQAAIPVLIDGARGGLVVITSSTAGIRATSSDQAGNQAYNASKRGIVGLMQGWANLLAPHSIRVNTIHPTGVATGMVLNDAMAALFAANDLALSTIQNALPIQMLQPEDIANAVAFLASDDARMRLRRSSRTNHALMSRRCSTGVIERKSVRRCAVRAGRRPPKFARRPSTSSNNGGIAPPSTAPPPPR